MIHCFILTWTSAAVSAGARGDHRYAAPHGAALRGGGRGCGERAVADFSRSRRCAEGQVWQVARSGRWQVELFGSRSQDK